MKNSVKRVDEMEFEEWLKIRERTTYVMNIQMILNGIEASLTFTYLYLYLNDVLHTTNPILFYSSIATVYSLFTILGSLVLGRIFDKYRNLRQMMIFCNVLLFVGNLLYCIPLSPWLLFFGRLFAGIGASSRSLMSGEIVRCYLSNETVRQMSRMGMFYGLGYVVGPGLNFFFMNANFYFLGIHIIYINGAVFLLMVSSIIQLLMTIIFVADLSKEHDIKAEEFSEKDDDEHLYKDDKYEFWNVIGKFMRSSEIVVIFLCSMLLMHVACLYDIWQPMAYVKFMKWNKFAINLSNFVYGICSIIGFMVFTRLQPTQKQMVYFTQGCIFLNICMFSIFLTWRFFNTFFVLDVILAFLYCIFFAVSLITEHVFFVTATAQMVPSDIQAFAEGVRTLFSRSGALTALLLSAETFQCLEYASFVYLFLLVALFVMFYRKRDSYINPMDIKF